MENIHCINPAVCIKDASSVEKLISSIKDDEQNIDIIEIALEPYVKRYNVSSISLEDSSEISRTQRIKEMAKRVLQAIIEFFKFIMRGLDKYQLKAEAITAACDNIETKLNGVSSLKKKSLYFSDERLKLSLYTSQGNNVRNSVNKLIRKAIDTANNVNYSKFVGYLTKLETTDDNSIEELLNEILLEVSNTATKNLNYGNVPGMLTSLSNGKEVNTYYSGPHCGERYIYCLVPTSVKSIRDFNIGVYRNIEVIPQSARLPALSTAEMWGVLEDCRNLANVLFQFDNVSKDLDRMEKISERIAKNSDSIKKLSALSIYPILIRGLHYSFLDVACDAALNSLNYCNQSIKVMKRSQDNQHASDF